MILACCVLHNLSLQIPDNRIEDFIREGVENYDNEAGQLQDIHEQWVVDDVHDDEAGKIKRDSIAINLL